uniref:DNA primase/polymerase bifunctional N-terminal domain-containing protein n=1 Tax=Mycolicibacterium gilvum (strain PYR-GCK) TaxID=350054 RepID=A4TCU5_MYCGI|nr:hypothetical protein Mflv_3896 [Mycolicibacterium gilvum PYR-GCK]
MTLCITGITDDMTMVQKAQHLHQRGFHVFPTDHPDQRSCIGLHGPNNPCDGHRGKHPAVAWGTWAVNPTPQMIDVAWKDRHGLANIGIACGPSGLVVLDEDGDGEVTRWCVTYGVTLPDTYEVTTGRGRHLYFAWDHTAQRIGNVPKAVKDFALDVRGDGGYAVGEGSQHVSGAIYTGNGLPAAPLPVQVAEILLAAQTKRSEPVSGPTESPWDTFAGGTDPNTTKIGFRERHNALIAYAGRLRNTGLDYTEALPVFRQRWLLCEQPTGQIPEAAFHSPDCPYPVTWDEADAKLRDVYERYAAGQADDGGDWREQAIEAELDRQRIRREARLRLEAETRPETVLPTVKPLNVLLAEPDPPARYRIDRLAPEGARAMLSAQFKAGKSTVVANAIRSLVDEEPFLGRFDVHIPARRLVLIDDELGENTLRRWLREQNITNTAAVADVVSLRGRLAAFDLLDDHCRQQWVQRLQQIECDYLILDCLRPVLDALGLDENRDAGRFLSAFDAMLTSAGIPDALLIHHMGHSGERSRGDSRLQDWPDALWRIVRETEEPDSERFFSAYGRDVNVPEGRLTFDADSRRLTYVAGSRSDAQADAARAAVINLLVAAARQGAKPNASGIEADLVPPHTQKAIRQAVNTLVRGRLVAFDDGPRNSKLYYIANPCDECRLPVAADGRSRHESCPRSAEEVVLL